MKILLFFIFSTTALINNADSLVTYGTQASTGQFRFAASIYGKGERTCNGAIISPFHVITAAHCVHNETIADLRVIVGKISVSRSTEWRQVQKIDVHSGYDVNGLANDIAIIQLKESLLFNSVIKSIDYETQLSSDRYSSCTVVHFEDAETESIHQTSRSLWFRNVVIPTSDECKTLYPNLHAYKRCIVNPQENFPNLKPGDSGAPIICNNKLTAIISSASLSYTTLAATVVMVAPYENWIGDTTY